MSDAAEVITLTFGGKTFRCSRRTAAHLAWTAEQLEQADPEARIVVIQGSYNQGVEASAGTHDYDAVLDVQVVGLEWAEAQDFFRAFGWAAWWRQPPKFTHHIHMISLGYPGRVGEYVPGQVRDYYDFKSGLAGHLPDFTWHPADIDSTIFDYDAWLEATMPLNDADAARIRAIVREELDAAEDRIKYTAPSGDKVSRRRFFEAWRKVKP